MRKSLSFFILVLLLTLFVNVGVYAQVIQPDTIKQDSLFWSVEVTDDTSGTFLKSENSVLSSLIIVKKHYPNPF